MTTAKKICCFEGCGKPVHGRGLCSGHCQQRTRGGPLRALWYQHRKPIVDGKRNCRRCRLWLPLSDFRQHTIKGWTGPQTQCRKCGHAVQREYIQRVKLRLLAALGGKCRDCGMDDPRVLMVHHTKNDGHKDNKAHRRNRGGTRRGAYYNHLIRRAKADPGCLELLCGNCHLIHHYEKGGHGRLVADDGPAQDGGGLFAESEAEDAA